MKQPSPIHSNTLAIACAALTIGLVLQAHAQVSQPGPLVELSQPYGLAGCNDGFQPPGTMTINDAAEPFVAVNPSHPSNLVAAWIGGQFQNLIVAASLDGGLS